MIQGLTPILTLAVSAAVLESSAQFGYNSGVFNSPQPTIKLKHVYITQVMSNET